MFGLFVGCVCDIAGGHSDFKGGTKWIGDKGWVWVNRGNAFDSSNPDWSGSRSLPEDVRKVKLHRTEGGNPHLSVFLPSQAH